MLSPVPGFTTSLNALAAILTKAEAHMAAKKIDPSVLFNARLFPDMLPLWRQITIACDHAKGASARLSGTEVPGFPDEEKTFADLQARIARTLAFIASVPEAGFADADGRTITLKVGSSERSFPAPVYLFSFAFPNFYFHMTTAYAILRSNGVALGKSDFMMAPVPA